MSAEEQTEEQAGERTPDQIKADIEATRAELGDTVAAVAEKADVKAHAEAKVAEGKAKVSDNSVAIAVGAAVFVVLAIVIARRRRG
jgi:hypothetical protein